MNQSKHEHEKEVINRLSKAIGHLNFVKNMVEEHKDCSEVLIQLSAVKSAIMNAGKILLMDHMEHCIVRAVEAQDLDELKKFKDAVNKFIK